MVNKQILRKASSLFFALMLVLSGLPLAGLASVDPADYTRIDGTDFEDGELWGFVGQGTLKEFDVTEDGGNQYLNIIVENQSGNRGANKLLSELIDDSAILITFDWKLSDVTTAANSAEFLLRDANGDPFFRLVRKGGTNGELHYEVGKTGTDLSTATATGVQESNTWLTTSIAIDYSTEKLSLVIKGRDDETTLFEKTDIDFGKVNYTTGISQISLMGNRSSGQALGYTIGLDNIDIYGSGLPAPPKPPKDIERIVSSYVGSVNLPLNVGEGVVATYLTPAVDVELENGVIVPDIPVSWSSDDYDPTTVGIYTFEGHLVLDNVPNVTNNQEVKALAQITLAEEPEWPVIAGYQTVEFTTFGDAVEVVPPYWGFTTANSTLSIDRTDVGGNTSAKLKYRQENQSGGRVATKNLATPVKGLAILTKFDWYPGELNDKGGNPSENGGELRILDASNNIIFTLNNTKNSPLRYFVGGKMEHAQATEFTNMETWYTVEVLLDLETDEVTLKIEEQVSETVKEYKVSLEGVLFDGSVGSIRLVGMRTSGNNITWSTYLDNFGLYVDPIPDETIVAVDRLPYHRVYVSTTTEVIESIGLPEQVTVTLADNTKVSVDVREWSVVDEPWNPEQSGVYEFRGVLDPPSGIANTFEREATIYVYNRLVPKESMRQTEWLDRGVIALSSDDGIFVSWRLLADEYSADVRFNLYRNGEKLNDELLFVTNFLDTQGSPGDQYVVETVTNGVASGSDETAALTTDYLAIPMQVPEGGATATSAYTYSVNDGGVGDLDGDGEYEVIVKWYPSNAIDSSQQGITGPTIFDAYKLDGTLLWRINMGNNLTSGAHYHQFIIADLDGDGKSEFAIKTADATTVYGTTNGIYDPSKVIDVIGNAEDDGKWINEHGHVFDGPEYFTVFNGETGEVIDTVDYAFPLGDVTSWGDSWHNRSDRFLAGLAYLDGVKPSVIYGRGYYERTTFVAYSLVDGKIVEEWTFDSAVEGRGGGLGYHSLATGDVDNDGYDEIIAGSLTLDHDGTILYAMDGEMGREMGSHGDAMHVGAFDPDREGLHFIGVHEVPAVASLEYHDGATGETIMSFYASKDAGRGLAANITSDPGYEFWGTAGFEPETGGGIYNVQGHVVADDHRAAGLSVNFALYWDGDLLHELLDHTSITKYNETTGVAELVRNFDGTVSNNGTKATPTLQADIIGDWREEVLLPSTDSSELRIYSTTIPTEYRLYTLMHDTVYRMGVAWQNVAYNQPPHIGFYLGEDIRDTVLAGELKAPNVVYTIDRIPPGEVRDAVVVTGDQQLTLKWIDPVDDDLSRIYISGAGTTVIEAVYVDAGVEQYTFTELANSVQYDFRISTIDTSGNESVGIVVSGKPMMGPIGPVDPTDPVKTPPADVSNARVSSGNRQLTLTWTDPADEDLKSIYITGSGATVVESVYVDAGIEQYTFTGLDNGVTYQFRISTVDVDDLMSNGITVSGIPRAPSSGYIPNVTPPAPSGDVTVGEDGVAIITPAANRSGDTLRVQISGELFDQALAGTQADAANKRVVIELDQDVRQVQVQLPHQAIRSTGQHEVEIRSRLGTIVLPSNMLSNMDIDANDTIEIVIAEAGSEVNSDRKVLEIHVLINGERVAWHNSDGTVTVAIPYEPTGLETELHEFISVVHIDDDGNRSPVYNGRYDAEAGAVIFETDHFSQFAVVFDPKTFSDIGTYDWARYEIEVLATKGIINGMTAETFNPAASITRADYLLLLMKTLGLNARVDSQFSDVHENDYFYEAVGIAKALGITNGDGHGKFNPRTAISRQDMFTLTARALAVSGYGLEDASEDVLADFSDREDISSYALETIAALVADELVIGNNGRVNPLGQTTRAEAAVFLYRIYSR